MSAWIDEHAEWIRWFFGLLLVGLSSMLGFAMKERKRVMTRIDGLETLVASHTELLRSGERDRQKLSEQLQAHADRVERNTKELHDRITEGVRLSERIAGKIDALMEQQNGK